MSLVKRSFGVNLYVLKYFCMYPPEKPTRLYKVGAFIMFLLLTVPVPVLSSLYFLLEEDIPLERVGDNAFSLAQSMVCFFKFMPFIINGDQIKKCIHYFESPLPIVFNDKQRSIVKTSSNICRRNSRAFLILFICAHILWSSRPFFLTEYRFPIDLWLPLNPLKKMTLFYSIYLYVVLGIGYIALACAVVDPLIGGLACMAAGQLSVIKDNLQHLDEYSETEFLMYTNYITSDKMMDKSEIMYNKIKMCIEQHNAILNFVKEYEECFSPVVFSQFMGSILVIGFCCFQLNLLNPLSFMYIQVTMCFSVVLVLIYFYCYYGTTLFEESNDLIKAIYMGRWYEYDIKSKKALLLLMERSQRPIKVTAGKLLDLSLETFTTILRRSYSLVAVLKNQQ